MDKLILFFDRIKGLTFFQRVFYWTRIKGLSYDAFQEFKSLESELFNKKYELDNLQGQNRELLVRLNTSDLRIGDFERNLSQKDDRIEKLNHKLDEFQSLIDGFKSRISTFEGSEEEKAKEYRNDIIKLNQVKEGLDEERIRLSADRLREKEEQFDRMKRQWIIHESSVKQAIRILCKRHLIDYVEKVPFKGDPDNTIRLCDEYIVFDAKSPANNDLTNFPRYIKTQTEIVKKYANQENVKRDIFLVIPSNTVEVLEQQFSYNLGSYNVFIVTIDALEPILLCLKKIESYNYVDELGPDERDNICRIIGRFAHTTKRKIQIDQFFANEFFEVLLKCKNDLPISIVAKVTEYEKVEKLNPPTEKRAKQILVSELQDSNNSIRMEAQIRDIEIPNNFEDVKGLE
jgi:hypothetical protein